MDLFGDFGVDCGNRVVEDENVRVSVKCPRERDPRLLSSRKGDSFLPDQGGVSVLQYLEIGDEAGFLDGSAVALLRVRKAEKDIVADGVRKDDWFLLDVGHAAFHLKPAFEVRNFPKDDSEEATLSRPDPSRDAVEDSPLEKQTNVTQRGKIKVILPITVKVLE